MQEIFNPAETVKFINNYMETGDKGDGAAQIIPRLSDHILYSSSGIRNIWYKTYL